MACSCNESAHRDRFDAQVERNRQICREHFLLRLRITGPHAFPATQPGQFIQLGCRTPAAAAPADRLLGAELEWRPDRMPQPHQLELCDRAALLRRPFSLSGRGDDEHGTWVEIIHRVVGVGTDWLSQLAEGDPVDLIGPLGNSFALPPGKSLGLLVGGGVGLPPMFYLAERLKSENWDAVGFVGALTRDLLAVTFDAQVSPDQAGAPALAVTEFARAGFPSVVTTDDGTLGLRGRITQGLAGVIDSLSDADRARAVVFTCGPGPMMQAVADLAQPAGIDCQVCMEQAMACGMGTCQSCIVKIEEHAHPHATTPDGRPWRYRLACTDGPVFPAPAVVW